jgi:hypothetical protein
MSSAKTFDSYYAKFVSAEPDATLTFGNLLSPKPSAESADEVFSIFRSRYQEFVGYSIDDDAFLSDFGKSVTTTSRFKSGSGWLPAAKVGLASAGGLAATAAVGLLMTADLSNSFASSKLYYSLPTQDLTTVNDDSQADNLSEQQAVPSPPESIDTPQPIGLDTASQAANSGRLVSQQEINRQLQEIQDLVDRLGVSTSPTSVSSASSGTQPPNAEASQAANDQHLQASDSSQIAQLAFAQQSDVTSQPQSASRDSASEALPNSAVTSAQTSVQQIQSQGQLQSQSMQNPERTASLANASDAASEVAIASLPGQPQSDFVECVSSGAASDPSHASTGMAGGGAPDAATDSAPAIASTTADAVARSAGESSRCFTNSDSDFVISRATTVDRLSASVVEQPGNRQIQGRSASLKTDAKSSLFMQQLEKLLSK